jgi:hypothetical protein
MLGDSKNNPLLADPDIDLTDRGGYPFKRRKHTLEGAFEDFSYKFVDRDTFSIK